MIDPYQSNKITSKQTKSSALLQNDTSRYLTLDGANNTTMIQSLAHDISQETLLPN